MSTWSDLGLPYLESPGYGYSVGAALLRTPFTTAHPRQRRKHTKSRKTFAAHVLLTQAQLGVATEFLETYGFTWFTIDLLSGEGNPSGEVLPHSVRLREAYSVSAAGYDLYRVELTLEQYAA